MHKHLVVWGALSLVATAPAASAAEGCMDAGFAVLRTLADQRGLSPEEDAFLQTPEGRFLSAALSGDLAEVERLLASGVHIAARDKRRRFWDNSALDHAARTDNVELAGFLLSRGFDVNARSNNGKGHGALHVATGLGREKVAEFLLKNKADPDIRDSLAGSPLDVAVMQARPTMARLLLKYGAGKFERVSPLKMIEQTGAICPGHHEMIRLLIESGTDLFARDEEGRSGAWAIVWRGDEVALYLATEFPLLDWNRNVRMGKAEAPLLMAAKCAYGSAKTFQYLMTEHPRRKYWNISAPGEWGSLLHCNGADAKLGPALVAMLPDPNVVDREGKTALHFAHDPIVLGALLKRGARVDAPDAEGMTPLMQMLHYDAQFDALLSAGASLSILDKTGLTVLHHAALEGTQHALPALLSLKVDPNQRTRDGRTALHVAFHEEPAALLITAGADVNAATPDGTTPLHSALARGAHTIGLLLRSGADPTARDAHGMTPLHHARRHEPILALLEWRKDLVGALDDLGRSALHYAAEDGTGAAIYALVKGGAPVDGRDKDGNTPLHIAALRGNSYTAGYLMRSGADPTLPNADGKSALDIAKAGTNSEQLGKVLRREVLPD